MFTSIIPIESDDPCTVGGGKSWVFAIDLFTGGSSTGKTFDINGDGEFNTEDMLIIRDGVVGTIRIIDGVEKIVTTSLGGSETVEDYVAEEGDIKLPASGVQLNQIVDSPRVLRDGTTNDYVSVISGSDGGDLKPLPLIDGGLFDLLTGRLNWQQLR
ncbi:hypothetical protein [Chromatium okenii]|uniref:Uncharacterized protein n=1 Tax=Chromatium okenii TaxID=61644 RepID=A0A2S7XNL2_9GAMM|nr:hypothetical protein [Chromatium okenii]PQJ95315.1 hypothetical protein CXB77_13815 [Chromatium okenii]